MPALTLQTHSIINLRNTKITKNINTFLNRPLNAFKYLNNINGFLWQKNNKSLDTGLIQPHSILSQLIKGHTARNNIQLNSYFTSESQDLNNLRSRLSHFSIPCNLSKITLQTPPNPIMGLDYRCSICLLVIADFHYPRILAKKIIKMKKYIYYKL